MKKKLLLAVLAVAVLIVFSAVVAVAADRYQQNKNQQAREAVKTVPADDYEALKNTTSQELRDLQADNGRLLAECQKGIAAYAKLTPAVQKNTQQPVCAAAPAQ